MDSKHTNVDTARFPTTVLQLLHRYGIPRTGIAKMVGKHHRVVYRALDPTQFGTVPHQHLLPIRAKIEHILTAAGWTGNPAELWDEYDKKLVA